MALLTHRSKLHPKQLISSNLKADTKFDPLYLVESSSQSQRFWPVWSSSVVNYHQCKTHERVPSTAGPEISCHGIVGGSINGWLNYSISQLIVKLRNLLFSKKIVEGKAYFGSKMLTIFLNPSFSTV